MELVSGIMFCVSGVVLCVLCLVYIKKETRKNHK